MFELIYSDKKNIQKSHDFAENAESWLFSRFIPYGKGKGK